MEKIFICSKLLSSYVEEIGIEFNIEWLANNQHIFPECDILPNYIWNVIHDDNCIKLSDNDLITAIKILHKYDVYDYYQKLIVEFIIRVLLLHIVPKIYKQQQQQQLCSDIISDIIHYDDDFSDILCFLFGYPTVLTINDFVFSLPLLELGLHNNYSVHNNQISCFRCIRGGIHVLDMLSETSFYETIKHNIFFAAACDGELAILDWVNEKNLPIHDIIAYRYAARNDHIDVLKWGHTNNISFDATIFNEVAYNGNLDALKWLISIGCKWNESTCELIARGGHLDILKWAIDIGCPWSDQIYFQAIYFRKTNILKWGKTDGRYWHPHNLREFAMANNFCDMLEFIDN